MYKKLTKKQIMDAVLTSDGTYTCVQKKLKMNSSITAKKYIHMYPDVLQAFNEVQDGLVDKAEHILFNNLNSDNEFIRQKAAEFALKNMPRSKWKGEQGEDAQLQLIKLLDRMIDSAEK